jgi:hypothetical protein
MCGRSSRRREYAPRSEKTVALPGVTMTRPNDQKSQVERATAQNFINWYNQQIGRNLALSRKQEAPDFIYTDDIGQTGLEVTTSFYNHDHATLVWKTARGHQPGANQFGIWEPEKALIAFINERICEKSKKRYGDNCLLIIRVILPAVTSVGEFEYEVMPKILVPADHPFSAIYLTLDQQKYFRL